MWTRSEKRNQELMIIHDHKLSQKQEKQAEKAVGETVCFISVKEQRSMHPVEFHDGQRKG